jgi:uncharacterized membrane protein
MGIAETVKGSLVAGLVLVAPLVVTVVAVQFVFRWLRGFLNPVIENTGLVELAANIEIAAEIAALLILLFVVTALGYAAQKSVGARAFALFDRAVGLIPLVSVVYGSVRQVSDALVKQQSRYENVVAVEFPRRGLYTVGFITAESPTPIETATGEDLYNVYLPNSPNPTQGHFVFVPTDQVTDVDMSVSRAIRLLVTTGIAEDERELAQLHRDVERRLDERDVELEDAFDGDRTQR